MSELQNIFINHMLHHQCYSCGHYLIAGQPAPNELKKSCINLSISISMGGRGLGKIPQTNHQRERNTERRLHQLFIHIVKYGRLTSV